MVGRGGRKRRVNTANYEPYRFSISRRNFDVTQCDFRIVCEPAD